jgi:sodium/proline symporter
MTEKAWTFLGVGVYLLVLLGIGFAASRTTKGARDFFAADKKLGFWSVAFSARATGESAWLLLGLTGLGAAVGARAFGVVLGEVLGVVGAWVLLSRRFHRLTQRYDSLTIPDYLESRFRDDSQLLRKVAAFALTVFVTIYVAAQIDATGAAFETFLGVNWYVGVFVGFGVVMAYSVGGGFQAVVWSDVFQGSLMFVGLVGLPVVAYGAVGGLGPWLAGLERIDPSLLSLAGPDGWSVQSALGLVGLSLIGLGFMGSPQIFARFLALRDEAEIPKGAWVALVWTLFADSGAVLVGMLGRVLLDAPGQLMVGRDGVLGSGAQDVLPMVVSAISPPVLIGLFIAIVLSAIMSTVDSLLVLASSAAVRDLYQQVYRPQMKDEELLSLSRLATLGLGLLALAVAVGVAVFAEERTVFWFVVFGWSGIAATFCPTMILSLYWRRFTRNGALAAMVVGFLSVPFFKFVGPDLPVVGMALGALEELPPSFAMSMLAAVVVSVLDKKGQERLAEPARELDEAASSVHQV